MAVGVTGLTRTDRLLAVALCGRDFDSVFKY